MLSLDELNDVFDALEESRRSLEAYLLFHPEAAKKNKVNETLELVEKSAGVVMNEIMSTQFIEGYCDEDKNNS
jgi:hypothetical protein